MKMCNKSPRGRVNDRRRRKGNQNQRLNGDSCPLGCGLWWQTNPAGRPSGRKSSLSSYLAGNFDFASTNGPHIRRQSARNGLIGRSAYQLCRTPGRN
ncbi:unnamed protein product [Soboliphyme baturini]|uniref:Coat protein n=1 Tax=Soboliphyme baturini TaxID=241478 RepID=A0A183IPQ5_9BILA|nr:unnamed protein product [Soboliphyme baturini]